MTLHDHSGKVCGAELAAISMSRWPWAPSPYTHTPFLCGAHIWLTPSSQPNPEANIQEFLTAKPQLGRVNSNAI